MQPNEARDFLRVARQRLEAARALLESGYTLDAQYLGGYTVECSLKAVILDATPAERRSEILGKLTSGSKMHRSDVLIGALRDLGVAIPVDLAQRHRRFLTTWATDLRYETGRRDTGETRGFLKSAGAFLLWAEDQSP